MAKLPPIQTSIKCRWREFRMEYLQFVAFGVSVVAAMLLWSEFALPHKIEGPTTDVTATVPMVQPTEATMATVARAAANGIPSTNTTASGYSD